MADNYVRYKCEIEDFVVGYDTDGEVLVSDQWVSTELARDLLANLEWCIEQAEEIKNEQG